MFGRIQNFLKSSRICWLGMQIACLCVIGLSADGQTLANTPSSDLRAAALALKSGQHARAHRLFKTIAEREQNSLAQYTLGLMAENGWEGSPPSAERACHWFEKAAHTGHDKSMVKLGHCLKTGTLMRHAQGSDQQKNSAAYWFQRAADMGHVEALCHLGELYRQGAGVPINTAKALQLCFHAAHSGSSWAQRQVGQHFASQSHFDFGQAAYWYQQAAVNGDAPAAYALAELYYQNPGVVTERFDLAGRDHHMLARDWYEVAAGLGHTAAYAKTAVLYYQALHQALNTTRTTRNAAPGQTTATDRELLAKTYLWLRASYVAHTPSSPSAIQSQLDQKISQSVLNKLKKILPLLPKSWIPNLESKIAAHFEQYPVYWPEQPSAPARVAQALSRPHNGQRYQPR